LYRATDIFGNLYFFHHTTVANEEEK